MEHMYPFEDRDVMLAMIKYGGSFVEALGRAAYRADKPNLERIKAAFPEYWQHYTEFAERDIAEEKQKLAGS